MSMFEFRLPLKYKWHLLKFIFSYSPYLGLRMLCIIQEKLFLTNFELSTQCKLLFQLSFRYIIGKAIAQNFRFGEKSNISIMK